ncbi:glycoside hydrolase family 31 protein [Mucisphaera calidilacus]|uniref:Alpha-xylosidase n=1 Tax=Mucisphaera calidilacus TaxID=2527982 RepID=A0A518BW08_9BACT|nr:TIM-barrel domain-containing protein [Mucisphaera calidilacus]QDU71114.1 Alpha-xylosidase [Mucisphaera calidilacus]
MYFNKTHQPENFVFNHDKRNAPQIAIDGKSFRYNWKHLGENVHRLELRERRWPAQHSQAELTADFNTDEPSSADFDPKYGVTLNTPDGETLLTSEPGRVLGVSGQSWLMQFAFNKDMRFYGMGEKVLGLELSGIHTKFWNTDVWADFNMMQVIHGQPDPMYLSIPYLIVKRGNDYIGILLNNPYAAFMSTNPRINIAGQSDADDDTRTRFFVGAPDGRPEIYFIVGPTLADLTRKLQRLVGTTPLPPLWSLGHHQCRWGYASFKDLDTVDQQLRKHKIPNDGLWLDIDYMTGFRVFTWDQKHWPRLEAQIDKLQANGQRVIPIIDPGVKLDTKYDVYKSGKRAGVYCKNPADTDFVGFVWPGTTVFPDFSQPRTREWWAGWIAKAVATPGIEGVWIDMNDPSTGASVNSEMLFDDGKLPHDAYHNQYAFGMAKATHEGFLKHAPDQRPFILTRSGYISSSRYSAAWTGDNYANDHHLKTAIPTTLNLALSGLPFNGPDVPGFGGDASPELAIAWYKAGFLFPVLRNHTHRGQRHQEPYAFNARVTRITRHYIRLRYKLLPYLYNLFVQQEAAGEAILRPLFYDFADKAKLPLDRIEDQFMVGPAIMQAPHLESEPAPRDIVLPKANWYDARTGRWIAGDRTIKAKPDDETTPLFIRDGAVIPMRPGTPTDNHTDLADIELHLFLSPDFKGKATCTYAADDGLSYAYQRGERTTITLDVQRKNNHVTVTLRDADFAYSKLKVRFVTYGNKDTITLRTDDDQRELNLREHRWTLTGGKLTGLKSAPVTLG